MSYVLTPVYTVPKEGAAAPGNQIIPLPGATTISAIYKATATFLSAGVRVVAGDGAQITGSGAGNDGTYLIVAVPDDNTIIVRATLAAEGATFNLSVLTGQHQFTITDEATTDWATITTAVAEPAFVDRQPTGGQSLVQHSLSTINVLASSIPDTTWTSQDEIVVSRQPSATVNVNPSGGAPALILQLGALVSSDKQSYWKGSCWSGFNLSGGTGSVQVLSYGSMLIPSGLFPIGRDSQYYGTLFKGTAISAPGEAVLGSEFQDFLFYVQTTGNFPGFLSGIAYADNIVAARTTAAGFMFGSVGVQIAGLAHSDSAATPIFQVINSTMDFLDPPEDYPLSDFIQIISGSTATKSYTFNPTIRGSRGETITDGRVYLWRIDQSTPLGTQTAVAGSPFTIDGSGQINSGAGVELAMVEDDGTTTNYFYRLVVEAVGYHQMDTRIRFVKKDFGDVVLRSYEPALEGEEATL